MLVYSSSGAYSSTIEKLWQICDTSTTFYTIEMLVYKNKRQYKLHPIALQQGHPSNFSSKIRSISKENGLY